MPSERAIVDAIEMLLSSGCVMTRGQNVSSVGVTWSVSMPEVSDQQLLAACLVHLRGSDCRWFPKPGQLLGYLSMSGDDSAGEDWAELRRLRRMHGRQQPSDPTKPERFSLSLNRMEAHGRWSGIQSAGGWLEFGKQSNPEGFRAGFGSVVEHCEREKISSRCTWSDSLRARVELWLSTLDVDASFRDCRSMTLAYRDSTPHNPKEPTPYRLHTNPKRERAMWAGLQAAGGWLEIWPDGLAIPPDMKPSDAANRKSFISTHRAVMARVEKLSECSRVAALVDMTLSEMVPGFSEIGTVRQLEKKS